MALPNTIEIKFEAKGDEVLIKTIKSLDKATKSLIQAQSSLAGEGKKKIGVDKANLNSLRKLNIELKLQGKNLKAVGLDTNLYSQALKGNKLSMAKIRAATKKYNLDLKKTRKGLLDTAHSTRILGGSFAVLRSKLLIASFALATFIRPLSKMIKIAGDANETLNKFNVVFGKYANEMRKWTREFGNSIGYAESTLQAFASTFQDTFVPLGFARNEAAKLSKSLTELAIDVASFSNKMDADVVRDFQSAMVGNHETVRKYGIIIQEANLKTKAYQMGIAETGEELTNAQKVMARFQLIVEGSADAIGDKEKTMGDYNNQIKTFHEQVKKTGEELGRSLMPLASQMLKLVSHFADPTLIKVYTSAIVALGVAYVATSASVRKFTIALRANKVALAATGYGLAIVALGELYVWYTNLKEQADDTNDSFDETALGLDKISMSYRDMIQARLEAGFFLTDEEKEEWDKWQEDFRRSEYLDEAATKQQQWADMWGEGFEDMAVDAGWFDQAIEKVGNTQKANLDASREGLIEVADADRDRVKALHEQRAQMIMTASLNQKSAKDTFKAVLRAEMGKATAILIRSILESVPFPLNLALATGAGALASGLFDATVQKFAKGGEFVTNKPEMIMVGEAGREHVKITPVDRPEERALGGGGVTVNIMGGIIQDDYVRNELIPAINKAKALA